MIYDTARTPADVLLYDDLNWPQVAEAIAARASVIVPLGATEQHGSHLPLGTDTYQGLDVARRAVLKLRDHGIPLVLGPAVAFGPRQFLSEAPRDFPGTIGLTHNTLKLLIEEICRELIRHGFRRVYLLMANAETDPVMQIAAKEVTDTTEAEVITLNWLVGAAPEYGAFKQSKLPQGHAGEGETARILAIAPHLVHMDKARTYHPDVPPPAAHGDKMPYLGGGVGRYKYGAAAFQGFDDGIWGDPRNARVEDGHGALDLFAGWVAKVVAADWKLDGG
ncbi:creatininase family protein [Falsiroseomonas oryzae]|uniref:creatininase family protein n=1 Tax=Falsiroseomonas oryzae TaxID=2766473 RepID=UPI0022EA73BC|nr:creatininase family protein [Roseomonas sp. MO-31]